MRDNSKGIIAISHCRGTNPFTASVLQPSGNDALPAGLIQSPPSKKLHQLQNRTSKKGGWVEEDILRKSNKETCAGLSEV